MPTEIEELQDDIDAVPLLASIHATRTAEADELWSRAVRYEHALQMDPDWQGRSRREQYEEIGRRLEEHLGPTAHEWLDDDSDDQHSAQPAIDIERASLDELEAAMEKAPNLDEFIDSLLGG